MRLPQVVIFLLTLFTTAHAFALPSLNDFSSASHDLFKRKGGGGGGGGGRGGGGSSSSSGGSSGSSSSGSRGGGSSGGSTGGTSSGGSTGSGGGARAPSYSGSGGRTYYGGGASTPYSAGRANPSTGRVPIALAAGSAALFILPGIWLYSVYNYNYQRPWNYYNQTSNQNVTHPVECLCEENRDCGCDENNTDQDYINNVANNGSIAALGNINGTETLVLNGTVPYGDDSSSGSSTTLPPNAALRLPIGGAGGWAIVAGSLTAALWLGL
jgi:hypothetical protein